MKRLTILLAVCVAVLLLIEAKHLILLAGLGRGGEWGMRAAFEQSLGLYGMVLEQQSGQPIAGATVRLSPIDHPGICSKDSDPTTVQTDAQACFSFFGRGLDLNVSVSKQGYYTLKDGSWAMFTHDGEDPSMHRRAFAANPTAPARLYLRKAGTPAAKLIYHDLSQRVPRDGSPGEINLGSGIRVPVGAGDVRVECWGNDDGIPGGTSFDWWYKITVPGGGLQARKDEFAFEAPENGYQSCEEVNMSASLGKKLWQDRIRRDFFLRLANGTYARVYFRVIPGGAHFFDFTYYYNPTPGDRNLETVSAEKSKVYR